MSKYNTLVGEEVLGVGGQRQRIGMSLYKNAQVIIFDEATSALDNETEKKVMDELAKLGDHITLIVVAHRLSTLKNCDKLIRVKNGLIEEIESYEKMLKLNEA